MKVRETNQWLKFLIFKSLTQGFTLTEMLITLLISGVIFTAAAGSLITILSTNRELDAKSDRNDELSRSLAFMENEIKQASIIQSETPGTGSRICKTSAVDGNCLKLIYLNPSDLNCVEKIVYYGWQDISSGAQTWLKPATIRRKEIDATAPCKLVSDSVTTADWTNPNWQVLADGILGDNEYNPNPTCEGTWVGPYGQNASNKGGFRFCLADNTATNRGVQIFLYGYILSNDDQDTVAINSLSFAKSPQ